MAKDTIHVAVTECLHLQAIKASTVAKNSKTAKITRVSTAKITNSTRITKTIDKRWSLSNIKLGTKSMIQVVTNTINISPKGQ